MPFFKNSSNPSFASRATAVLLGASLSAPTAWAADKAKTRLEDPTRTYTFEYSPDKPQEALTEYVKFIKKSSPGLEGLRVHYLVADMLMQQGQYKQAAEILLQLTTMTLNDEYFSMSIQQKLGDCFMRMGNYQQASGRYGAVSQGGAKAIVPEAILGLAVTALALGERDKAYLHFQELTAF